MNHCHRIMTDPPDDDENDVEAPGAPPTTPHTPSSSDRSTNKHLSAEPPRWRFVADAKKSSGYSSLAAGQYVQGKSNTELVAELVAKEVSLYKAKEEKPEVGSVFQIKLPVGDIDSKEDGDVKIGRLNFPRDEISSSLESELGEKLERFPEDGYTTQDLQTDIHVETFGKEQSNEENLEDQSLDCIGSNNEKASSQGVVSKADQNDVDQPEYDIAMEEGASINSSESSGDKDVDNSANEDNPSKRHRLLYFLLVLILLILAIVLGVLLGKKNNAGDPSAASDKAVATPDILGPITRTNFTTSPSSYPTTALTDEPSSIPSAASSAKCKVNTKEFSIEHPSERKSIVMALNASTYHATWILKNACSGEVLSKCRPCVNLTLTSPQSNLLVVNNEPTRRTEEHTLQNITECLPANGGYVFEVQPVEVPELCCGFDPNSFTIIYDNTVMLTKRAADGNGSNINNTAKVYFGERETPCKSESTSAISYSSAEHYLKPSQEPSYVPSNMPPTHRPSNMPQTTPTITPMSRAIPTAFPTKDLSTSPSNGHAPSTLPSNAPSTFLTPQPTGNPTTSPTKSPTNEPTTEPSTSPSKKPSTSPVKQPSTSPTSGPSEETVLPTTPQPTDGPTDPHPLNPQWFQTEHDKYQAIVNNDMHDPFHSHLLSGLFCHQLDLILCPYDAYCPNGQGNAPYKGGPPKASNSNTLEENQWSPLYGNVSAQNSAAGGTWVQVGKKPEADGGIEGNGYGMCYYWDTQMDGSGGDIEDVWGEEHRQWILCCDRQE